MNLSEVLLEAQSKLQSSPVRNLRENNAVFKEFDGELLDIERNVDILLQDIDEPVKVVLMGEVKAGKSTLLNSMVGGEVSPTDVLEATAAIIEVYYSSKEEGSIVKRDGNIIKGSLDEIKEILHSHHRDLEFFEECELVRIGMPLKNLRKIRVVDTPGIATITQQNSKKTEDFIQKADVILWVFNAHALGQSDIEEHIANITKMGKKVVGIINRIDEVEDNPVRLLRYMEKSLGVYIDDFFAVSAYSGLQGIINEDEEAYEESGVKEILDYTLENIEKEPELVHIQNIKAAAAALLTRDIKVHIETKEALQFIKDNISRYKEKLDYYNSTIKDYLLNEIRYWYNNEFFKDEEMALLHLADNPENLNENMGQYFNESYIKKLFMDKTEALQNELKQKWESNLETEYVALTKSVSGYSRDRNFYTVLNNAPIGDFDNENTRFMYDEITKGVKKGAAAGVALSGFFAWIGPGAAQVTLAGAMSTLMPPAMIVGAALGLVGAAEYQMKKKKQSNEIKRQLLDNIWAMKESVNPAINHLEKYFTDMSDKFYEHALKELKSNMGAFMDIEDIVDLEEKINSYINDITIFSETFEVEAVLALKEGSENPSNMLEDLLD